MTDKREAGQGTGEGQTEIYLARQPIFDARQAVVAYELLYRSSPTRGIEDLDGTVATARVIVNSFMTIGPERLTAGRRAFINFTREMLLSDLPTVLPPDQIVIEILENIEADEAVVEAVRQLKRAGYMIALDDFVVGHERRRELLELADVVKVDLPLVGPEGARALVDRLAPYKVRLLAEKVETAAEFEQARNWGYHYFQGYFFSRPVVITAKDIAGYKLNYLRLLQRIHAPELDFHGLEAIIRAEVSLSVKLLRFVNSAAFGWRHKTDSILNALVRLGESETRKWVSLICLTSMAEDKPRELLVQSAIRANFCETLGELVGLGERRSELFLTGLFSLLETIVGRPLAELLESLPLAADCRSALLEGTGPFAAILATVVAYERGEWEALGPLAEQLGLDPARLPEPYVQALDRAQMFFAA